jgi:peroxiredoxin
MKKAIKSWALYFLLLIVIYSALKAWQLRDVVEGEAPQIMGVTLEDQVFSLQAMRGKPVLVYFWATWCPICKTTQGSVESIANDYQVITIAAWSGDEGEVNAYRREKSLTANTLVDEWGAIAKQYGIKGVPAFFIIDSDGNIQFVEKGYTSELGLRLRLWYSKL